MNGKFRRLPAEVTAKLVDHPVLLPTKRGAVSIGREVLCFEFGEKNVYPRNVFLRHYEPVDQAAKDLMRKLIDPIRDFNHEPRD